MPTNPDVGGRGQTSFSLFLLGSAEYSRDCAIRGRGITYKTMKGETQTTITAEQRKAFADLLKPNGVARERALSALRDAESQFRKSLVDEEAGKCGALELAREIVDL